MDQYPRFSFRLTPAILRKVNMLARVRNGTRGQVVREAIEVYFAALSRPADTQDVP